MERRADKREPDEDSQDHFTAHGIAAAIRLTQERAAWERSVLAAARPGDEPPGSIERRAMLEAPSQIAHTVGCSDPVAEAKVQAILAGIQQAKALVVLEDAEYYAAHSEVEPPSSEPTYVLDGQTGYFYQELSNGPLQYAGQAARQVWA